MDVALVVKSESEIVEVRENTAALNTENAVPGETPMNNKDINQLPSQFESRFDESTGRAFAVGECTTRQSRKSSAGGANASMVGFSVDGISTANVRQNGACTGRISFH